MLRDYAQALVTLTDAVTKQRRDYWLGEYGTSVLTVTYRAMK